MNRTFTQKSIRFCLLTLTLAGASVYAQELKKPMLGFSDACATAGHNSFSVELNWIANPVVDSDNKFIVELSDSNGSFSSPQTLATLTDKNVELKFEIDLSFPTTVRGENYKIRWRSTSPAKTSPASDPFGAYYITVDAPLVVNNFEEASVCDETTVFLEVDNFPNEPSYNWYREDMTQIPGEHGPSIEVSEPGIYFAEIDYGSYCSSSTASNRVEVFIENSIDFELIGEKKLSLCEDQTYTLTTDLEDPTMTYAWYKDGELLEKNNKNTLEVKGSDPGFAGDYYVVLERPGGCKETTSTVSIEAGGFQASLSTPQGTLLIPQQEVIIEASTTAVNPKFQWYRNGSILTGETNASLSVSVAGDYYVEVAQQEGCIATRTTDQITINEPSEYVANIVAVAYTPCESKSTNLSLESLVAIAGKEEISLNEAILKEFSYQWVYNNKDIEGATGRSLALSDVRKNGNYSLNVNIEGGIKVTSSPIDVKLSLSANPSITADNNISCDNGSLIDIYSSITADEYTYTWYRNGVELTENSSKLSTNLSGSYQLKIAAYGCSVLSNEFKIEELSPSIVSIDAPEIVVVPEGQTKTITASGGDSYQWFNPTNELIGSESSITLSEEGEYTLVVGVGECQLSKTVKVTNLVSYVIPNVITPNGDGYNDLWVIPNSYAYQKDVTINIYQQTGAMVYSTNEYQNNWPESSSIQFIGGQAPIYYYRITKGKETLKQGTITVIK